MPAHRHARALARAIALSAVTLGLATSAAPASAVSVSAVGTASRAPASAPASAPVARFTLGAGLLAGPAVPVTMAPAGLSIEYPLMVRYLGAGACPPPALVAELESLGSPPLELAGVSQDMVVPSARAAEVPRSWEGATLYPLPATFWSQLHCLLQSARDPLTAGLNVRTGYPAWAAQMAGEAEHAAIAGLSFSLGNEPDLYGLPNYSALDKPLPGEEAAAAALYAQLAGSLRPAIGAAPLVGPELARPFAWRAALPGLISSLHEQIVGVHMYPLSACARARDVSIGGLLSSYAGSAPARLRWVVADAQAAGVPAIISEANSASCGGVAGVSDSAAAAVWAARFVLSALQSGFHEVRFHSSGNAYDPFLVEGSAVVERPIDSALIALNRWLPVGSSLHAVRAPRGVLASAVQSPLPAAAPPSSAGAPMPQPLSPSPPITLILDNESSRPREVLVTGARTMRLASLSPRQAGLRTETLSAHKGRVKLTLAPNSILAVSSAP